MIKKACYFRTFNNGCFQTFVRFALALILLAWVLGQNIVTPEIAFLTFAWYNLSAMGLVLAVPNACTLGAEALKSIRRIEV